MILDLHSIRPNRLGSMRTSPTWCSPGKATRLSLAYPPYTVSMVSTSTSSFLMAADSLPPLPELPERMPKAAEMGLGSDSPAAVQWT